jgi:hypothetical protein
VSVDIADIADSEQPEPDIGIAEVGLLTPKVDTRRTRSGTRD